MSLVRIQHSSLQFSDDRAQHEHDVRELFDHAESRKVHVMTGTEGGNPAYKALIERVAKEHRFYTFVHHAGEWVAVSKQRATVTGHGFDGPFIAAKAGLHSERGIVHVSADIANLGEMTFGVSHYLAPHSVQAGGDNAPLIEGIRQFGHHFGGARKIVFFSADANEHDNKVDVFHGAPFTTIADEVRKHPATHGVNKQHGADIDIIASYDHDGRVSAHSYRVLDDSDLRLFGDHFVLEASFEIESA